MLIINFYIIITNYDDDKLNKKYYVLRLHNLYYPTELFLIIINNWNWMDINPEFSFMKKLKLIEWNGNAILVGDNHISLVSHILYAPEIFQRS